MSILVTGGAGYIGTHTLVELLENGYETVVMDNYSNSSPKSLAAVEELTGKKIKSYEADISSREDLERIFTENPDIKEYFISMFMDADRECICAAGLDNSMKIVCGRKIADGDLVHVASPVRLIYDFSCAVGCSRIVIAHNHPHSDCLPSASDVYNTAYLVKALGLLEIELTDHIIVGEGGAVSLRGSMHAKDIWQET